jgi:uncharacterized OB-fold protein
MTELEIQRCERCGKSAFPDRLWCPGCGAGALRHIAAGLGRVEEETTLRRSAEAVRLGTVRLDSGPMIIARLSRHARAGTQVHLELAPSRTIWARATPD